MDFAEEPADFCCHPHSRVVVNVTENTSTDICHIELLFFIWKCGEENSVMSNIFGCILSKSTTR